MRNQSIDPVVSVDWLQKNRTNPNLVILDASIPSVSNNNPEFPNIQIQGARFFDIKKNFSNTENSLPNMLPNASIFTSEAQKLGINKDSIIVVYDNLGIYSSPRVWWMFKTMGHQNIAVLNGGLSAWKRAKFLCENKKQQMVKSGNFEANFQENMIKNASEILENITTKRAIVIDVRANDRFIGKVKEPRKGLRSGHIPNSINIPYKLLLKDGFFLPKKNAKNIFAKHSLQNKDLIFTCGSGITACIVLLASTLLLDNQKAVYDGSWTDWGQQKELPIA